MEVAQANRIGDGFRTYCMESGIPAPTVSADGSKYTYHFSCDLGPNQIKGLVAAVKERTGLRLQEDVALTYGAEKTRIEVATYGIEGPTP